MDVLQYIGCGVGLGLSISGLYYKAVCSSHKISLRDTLICSIPLLLKVSCDIPFGELYNKYYYSNYLLRNIHSLNIDEQFIIKNRNTLLFHDYINSGVKMSITLFTFLCETYGEKCLYFDNTFYYSIVKDTYNDTYFKVEFKLNKFTKTNICQTYTDNKDMSNCIKIYGQSRGQRINSSGIKGNIETYTDLVLNHGINNETKIEDTYTDDECGYI